MGESLIKFVANYDDLSTDRGYQFKFYCDHCRNGYLSEFEASVIGTVGELLRGAGSLLGGVFGQAGNAAYNVQRAVGGKQHDDALRKAIEAAKIHFKQCTRCGRWVCPDVCWNEKKGLCEGCAPNLEEEAAAAQAQAARDQVFQKARETPLVDHVDMKREQAATCAGCGAALKGGKFCPECGRPVTRNL